MYLRYIHIVFFLLFGAVVLSAQNEKDTLPVVFLIGEHESAYNDMLSQGPELIMNVCNNDMDAAYSNWLNFLIELEKFAIEKEVDINGIKLWINVFWNGDGTVKHITYYPKPNSRNMEYDYITVLFTQFAEEYHGDLKYDKIFCHYGSASFPSFITKSRKDDK